MTELVYGLGMRNFHDFYFGLSQRQRDDYLTKVGTTVGYAERVAGGFVLPSLRMCLRFHRAAPAKVTIQSIVSTFEAKNGKLA